MTRVRFVDDYLHMMARWAAHHYGLDLQVGFVTDWKAKPDGLGLTEAFSKTKMRITLNVVKQNLSDMMDTLVHELAHALTWKEKQTMRHGREFKKNFYRVVADWNAHTGFVQ